jgi:hypothetical protein
MRHHLRISLSTVALTALLLMPVMASAQTPEPAAGNPAINNTPKPSGGDSVTSGMGNSTSPSMASPSNEENIPKGSNPNSANGNLGPGSGGTPSSSASDNSMPSQTGANARSGINDSRPSQTATDPDAKSSTTSGASGADSVSPGKYSAPPNTDAE